LPDAEIDGAEFPLLPPVSLPRQLSEQLPPQRREKLAALDVKML
jgi:hypothetical protein